MSELLVAQCPSCQTRFRLSQEHLHAAAGNVRCGACLKVFNAHLAINADPHDGIQPQETPPAAKSRQVDSPTDRSGPLMIHDDLDLDEFDLEDLGLDESLLEEINPAARTHEYTGENLPDQAELHLDTAPEPETEPSMEKASLDSDMKVPEQDSEPDPWDMLEEPEVQNKDLSDNFQKQEEPALSEHTEEDFDFHEDFLATPIARDFASRSADEQAPVIPNTPEQNGIFLRDRPAEVTGTSKDPEAESAPEKLDDPTERNEPHIGSLIDLPDIPDETVVLYEQPVTRRSRYRLLWLALSILAMLGLPAQAVFYNFSTLAHGEQTRPYVEKLCLLAGCELPARVNIELIRSSNLMVRPHTEYPKALAIDVILYNRAEFAQPFPVLRMTFNDTRGREVLSKRFRPDEYLGGELAGVTLMPPQTPVHVALDMLDPGPEAAGYQLDFLSP